MKFLIIIILVFLLSSFKGQAQLPSERANSIEKILAYRKDKPFTPSQTTLTSLPSESKDWHIRVEKIKTMFKTVTYYQEPKLITLPSTQNRDLLALARKYRKI